MSDSPLSNPAISEPITITTITPIATPRMVNAARILCARNDPNAIPTPSNKAVMRSLLPQGENRVEPGGPARGVDTGDDAHAGAQDEAEHDRRPRQARREGGDGLEGERQS